MHHTTESSSTVCITPWSQAPRCASYLGVKGINLLKTPQCASYRRVKLRSVHHTMESSFVVCITPPSQVIKSNLAVRISPRSQAPRVPCSQVIQISQKAPWCASHREVKLCGVLPTAESSSTVCIPPRTPRSQAPRYASHRIVKLHTAESKSKSLLVSGCF